MLQQLCEMILTQRPIRGINHGEAALSECWGYRVCRLGTCWANQAGEGYVEIRENRGICVAETGLQCLRNFFLTAPMIQNVIL